MSKLINLKKWFSVSDAAEYLTKSTGEAFSEADILALVMDGKINLSVRFSDEVPVEHEGAITRIHTDTDAITPAVEKKLKAMGFPNMWGTPSPKKANAAAKGVVAVSDEPLDLSERFPVIGPAEEATFEVAYCAEDKSVTVKLSGTFDCWKTDDVKRLKNVACLFIDGITLQDAKGKDIKGPKDEYGMASRLEANIAGSYSEPGQCYQIPVKVTLEKT